MSLGAGATLALTPELLRALQQSGGKLIQRAIPSSGEMLPVIGLQFGNHPAPDHAALKEVLKTLVDNGGRFLDAVHQSARGGGGHRHDCQRARDSGQDLLVVAGLPCRPAAARHRAAAKAQIETSFARFKVPKIDLVMMNPMADPGHLAALKEMKKAGRVRYIGVQVIDDRQYAELEAVMRNEPIDFIGVDYSIDNRGASRRRSCRSPRSGRSA